MQVVLGLARYDMSGAAVLELTEDLDVIVGALLEVLKGGFVGGAFAVSATRLLLELTLPTTWLSHLVDVDTNSMSMESLMQLHSQRLDRLISS